MKSLASCIQEKLINKKNKSTNYKYFPKTKMDLKTIIRKRINSEGNEVDLNDIDISAVTNMTHLFADYEEFNGDISNWDVSHVTDMYYMFYRCTKFNQDISKWDVSNVTDMSYMFYGCTKFNQDISKWNVSNVTDSTNAFEKCPIEAKNKPKFK